MSVFVPALPDILFIGAPLDVACTSTQAPGQHIAWVLITESEVFQPGFNATSVHFYVKERRYRVSDNELDTVRSTLHINNITQEDTGLQIVCMSHQPAQLVFLDWFQHCETLNTCDKSGPLRAQFGPGRPQLQVYYHRAPDLVVRGHSLVAKCSAVMSRQDTLMWVVLGTSGVYFPRPYNNTGRGEIGSVDTVVNASYHMIESYLEILDISDQDTGTRLLCLSHQVPVDIRNWEKYCLQVFFCEMSLPIKVIELPVHNTFFSGEVLHIAAFIAGLLLLVGCGCACCQSFITYRKPPSSKLQASGGDDDDIIKYLMGERSSKDMTLFKYIDMTNAGTFLTRNLVIDEDPQFHPAFSSVDIEDYFSVPPLPKGRRRPRTLEEKLRHSHSSYLTSTTATMVEEQNVSSAEISTAQSSIKISHVEKDRSGQMREILETLF
ncbi:hypothetical protein ElyMa_002720000 [Elysia marginata]|uniref:Ig-like domain-containing protein n=1 Tax=Elysia marginata TaxID=1093978 RepID=A0AAV4HH56_9GAST|nr:hypothetical protein ElyMa_002720000 [Elysia marginata]